MGHLAVVLAYLHAILLFWRDSKHIEPERVEEVLEELRKARLVTDEEPCDGETLERTINAELEVNLLCPQGFKYFDKISKFSDIAKMPEEPEHLLQKKRIELVKASAVVQSLSAELRTRGLDKEAESVLKLIPQYGTQYNLYFLCGPIMVNLIMAITSIIHYSVIGNNQAEDTAICYIVGWGTAILWDVIITECGAFKRQVDFTPGDHLMEETRGLSRKTSQQQLQEETYDFYKDMKLNSHDDGHNSKIDVREFFMLAEGNHMPPLHEEYRIARLKGLAVIVWGETILQLTGTGVTPTFMNNKKAYIYLMSVLAAAILFAKTYFTQSPKTVRDYALSAWFESPFRCNLWNHVLHPLYFFAALAFGGGVEVVYAVMSETAVLPDWKGIIVFDSMGALIILTTCLLICHNDSQRMRTMKPLPWLAANTLRFSLGVVAIVTGRWHQPWKEDYASGEDKYFLGFLILVFAGAWYCLGELIQRIGQLMRSKAGRANKQKKASKRMNGGEAPANASMAPPTMGKAQADPIANTPEDKVLSHGL